MDTLVQLGHQYKSEFEDKYEVIRQRGLEQLQQVQDKIQQIQPELQSKQEELVAMVQDTSPVADGYAKPIAETFAWTAVLLFAAYTTSLVSGVILAPLVGLFIGSATAFLIAFGALPVAAILQLDNNETQDIDIRFKLLAFAAIEGILSGYLLSERYLSTIQPFSFVTPLVIAVVGSLAETKIGNARTPLIGTMIGASAVAHLLIGLVLGLSFAYVTMVLLYSAVGAVAVQFMLSGGDYNNAKSYVTMLGYFLAALYVQLVVFVVFGGPKESMKVNEPVQANKPTNK